MTPQKASSGPDRDTPKPFSGPDRASYSQADLDIKKHFNPENVWCQDGDFCRETLEVWHQHLCLATAANLGAYCICFLEDVGLFALMRS